MKHLKERPNSLPVIGRNYILQKKNTPENVSPSVIAIWRFSIYYIYTIEHEVFIYPVGEALDIYDLIKMTNGSLERSTSS